MLQRTQIYAMSLRPKQIYYISKLNMNKGGFKGFNPKDPDMSRERDLSDIPILEMGMGP